MKRVSMITALTCVAISTIAATSADRGPAAHGRRLATSNAAGKSELSPGPLARLRTLLARPRLFSGEKLSNKTFARAQDAQAYRVIDLQKSLPLSDQRYFNFFPTALNNRGQIVGVVVSQSSTYPYLIDADGTGAYLATTYYQTDYPLSINNAGTYVAGNSAYVDPSDPYTTYDSGVFWKLTGKTGSTRGTSSLTLDSIANQDIGVGNELYRTTSDEFDLRENSCGRSGIYADTINDSGLIGGNSEGPDTYSERAVVMKIGGCPAMVPNLPPGSSNVSAVNKNGDLLIDLLSDGPLLWKHGRVNHFPLPPDVTGSNLQSTIVAVGINASDAVVGTIGNIYPPTNFLYEHGKSVDLASLFPANSGWKPVEVSAINDNGEIVGIGYKDGVIEPRGFALVH